MYKQIMEGVEKRERGERKEKLEESKYNEHYKNNNEGKNARVLMRKKKEKGRKLDCQI